MKNKIIWHLKIASIAALLVFVVTSEFVSGIVWILADAAILYLDWDNRRPAKLKSQIIGSIYIVLFIAMIVMKYSEPVGGFILGIGFLALLLATFGEIKKV